MNSNQSPIKSLLIIIPLIAASWILVHVIAFLGIFLGVAYPMWWLFAPAQTICFWCRANREGSTCIFCKKQIVKSEGVSPAHLSSAILNGIVIVIFSLISLGIVYGESQLLFRMGFPATPKTASFIIPSKGQYRLGELIPMRIDMNNFHTAINAVQADVGFDSDRIEAQEISTKGSFASIFIQKEINNQGGWARLTGGLPNPGYSGEGGVFGTIFFKGKTPGIVRVQFLGSSMVLANDGRGTNILKDLPSASYLILPERISNEEEEEQQKILSSNVLGASTQRDQMNFYDEKSPQVLGASTIQKTEGEKSPNIIMIALGGLERIDSFILTQTQHLFSFFIR